ncbi:hypothetical protein, partial [Xanthomonas citri]|uniref:hypothetical protein n=1 Tax=Xanthomonas citri TaxID=346 RepID=UPI001CBC94F7
MGGGITPSSALRAPSPASGRRKPQRDLPQAGEEGGTAMQIAEAAWAIGIRDLRQSALMKAAHAVTGLAEITRVTKEEGWESGSRD